MRIRSWLIAAALAIATMSVPPSPTFARTEEGPPQLLAKQPASTVLRSLSRGEPVDLVGVEIIGDLDLRLLGKVTAPLRCVGCMFRDSVLATDVVFDRIVDLSATQVLGDLDARGAVFSEAFVLNSTAAGVAGIGGIADLRLASFSSTASFDGARFAQSVKVSGASFIGDASFADTDFRGRAQFDSVDFNADAIFTSSPSSEEDDAPTCAQFGGAFRESVRFDRAEFGAIADFQQRCFGRGADMRDIVFSGATDFLLAKFEQHANFSGSAFRGKTSFQAACFLKGVEFDLASAESSLAFDGATVVGVASFFGVTGAGTISLEGVNFGDEQGLVLTNLFAPDVRIDVEQIPLVDGAEVQQEVLELIERSARARGEIGLANEAHYALLSLQRQEATGLHLWFDQAYRFVGGYLVRPSRPLLAFAVLFIIAFLLRLIWRRPRSGFDALRHTAAAAFRKTPESPKDVPSSVGSHSEEEKQVAARRSGTREALAWAESLSFKLLLVLFLFGLANSNSTTRQIIEAIWR